MEYDIEVQGGLMIKMKFNVIKEYFLFNKFSVQGEFISFYGIKIIIYVKFGKMGERVQIKVGRK